MVRAEAHTARADRTVASVFAIVHMVPVVDPMVRAAALTDRMVDLTVPAVGRTDHMVRAAALTVPADHMAREAADCCVAFTAAPMAVVAGHTVQADPMVQADLTVRVAVLTERQRTDVSTPRWG